MHSGQALRISQRKLKQQYRTSVRDMYSSQVEAGEHETVHI